MGLIKSKKKTACLAEKSCPEVHKIAKEYYEQKVLPRMDQNSKEFQKCYSKYIATQPNVLIGNVDVIFKIEDDGKISNIKIIKNDFKNTKLADCISVNFQKIFLPIPPMKIKRDINHSFFFKSKQKIKKRKLKRNTQAQKKEKEVDGMELLPKYLPMR